MSTLAVDGIQNAAGTSAATIDSNGKISTTQGFLPKCYAFRATKHVATNWTTGGGTGSAITFNNISTNDCFNSGFDLSEIATTGKIYIPVTGIYRVSAGFLTSNTNSSGGQTYITVAYNNTDGSGGAPAVTLQNNYGYNVANTHAYVMVNTIFKGTAGEFFCITKEETLQYWSNGTNVNAMTWGYNQVCCELIGVSQ